MKITVIIPTMNSSQTINRCVSSLVQQTFKDLEILIMDGLSKDETISIVEAFRDNRIRVFSSLDAGVYDAMNKGINYASGEWFYFLGSDDYLLTSRSLENIVSYLDSSYDVVYGEVESNLPEQHRGEWTIDKLFSNRCHQAIFYNKRFFEDGTRYNLEYKILADFAVNLKWLLDSKYKSKYIPVEIAHYCTNGISSQIYDDSFWRDFGSLAFKYNRNRLPALYKKKISRFNCEKYQSLTLMKLYWEAVYLSQYILQHIQIFFRIPQDAFIR